LDSSEVNRVKREIRQLVLAIKDMRLTVEGAETLSSVDYFPNTPLIETGMVVTYCRAYSLVKGRRPPVTAQMLPEDDRGLSLHNELVKLRDTIYAHSDETDNRVVVDPFGAHNYTEGSRPWKREAFGPVIELARAQEAKFREALTSREASLRAAGVPPDPSLL